MRMGRAKLSDKSAPLFQSFETSPLHQTAK